MYSGLPLKFLRSSGFWVQMPMGQVSRLHNPHHDAALGHQQAGAKAEFLRAQHAADGHIPAAEQLGVALDPHPGAQPVQDQGLVGLGDAQFPGQAGVFDGGAGGRAGAAVIARHQDDLRAGLGDAGRDGAHAPPR